MLSRLSDVKIDPTRCSPPSLEEYSRLIGNEIVDEIRTLARDLAGVCICHINSTANGGGVAEILSCQIPFLRDIGVSVDWRLMQGSLDFFETTKGIHNGLQGDAFELTDEGKRIFLEHNQENAALLSSECAHDVYIVHDPQPAGLAYFASECQAKWIWRCHIDTSDPNPDVWDFLHPFIEPYDAVIFTLEDFVPPDLQTERKVIIPPAIDPFCDKNRELSKEDCCQMLAPFGVNLQRPILLQVSRFDPWKDPHGVIQAYRLVKQTIPDVQLVLVWSLADDDPEGESILNSIENEAAQDEDLYVFTNLNGVDDLVVNAFQRQADLVIQKSLKEGFGLVVSEAFWKQKPVVAGKAGGIPLQVPAEFQHYLVESVQECAEAILHLLAQPGTRARFGQVGWEQVRQQFLLPRLVRDELALVHSLIN